MGSASSTGSLDTLLTAEYRFSATAPNISDALLFAFFVTCISGGEIDRRTVGHLTKHYYESTLPHESPCGRRPVVTHAALAVCSVDAATTAKRRDDLSIYRLPFLTGFLAGIIWNINLSLWTNIIYCDIHLSRRPDFAHNMYYDWFLILAASSLNRKGPRKWYMVGYILIRISDV